MIDFKFKVGQTVFTPCSSNAVVLHLSSGKVGGSKIYIVGELMESMSSHPYLEGSWIIKTYTESELEEPIIS